MGNFFDRFFEFPIKRPPICFHRMEDFSATGEKLPPKPLNDPNKPQNKYEILMNDFYSKLHEIRQRNNEIQKQDNSRWLHWYTKEILEDFPGWNDLTISNLHSLYVLFNHDTANGLLNLKNFLTILDSLGYKNPDELYKEKRFDDTDTDKDGYINYEEFLNLMYNLDPQTGNKCTGLALICYETAEKVRFVNNLTLGEQLEYGLF